MEYKRQRMVEKMSNSKLVDVTVKSPNHSGRRTHAISYITPHCVVGQLDAKTIGACFPKGCGASCNYGIGKNGDDLISLFDISAMTEEN